jgi:hypothetical protein
LVQTLSETINDRVGHVVSGLIEEENRRSFFDGMEDGLPIDTFVNEPGHWMGETIGGVHFVEFERELVDLGSHCEKAFIGTLELINTLKMITTNDELGKGREIMDKLVNECV